MSDATSQTLTVTPILPAEPIVICGSHFLHSLAEVERETAYLKITDAATAQAAATLLGRLTTAGTALEAARKKVKAPFLAKCVEIDDAAKAPATRIELTKRAIKDKVAAFDAEQQRLAREAEVARQAELRRLEALRLAEQKAAQEKADALAALAAKSKMAIEDVAFDDDDSITIAYSPPKTETEKRIDEVRMAPALEQVKPVGVSWRVSLKIESIDVNKLPEIFVTRTANETALRMTFCKGYKENDPLPVVAGVVFKVLKDPVHSGKDVF